MKPDSSKKILLSTLAILFFQISALSQTDLDLLNTRIEINQDKTSLFYVLNRLAFEFRVPIGLELAADYRERDFQKFFVEDGKWKWDDRLVVKAGTLREILESLIAQEPQYKWRIRDGVVNVYPTESRDKTLKRLLDTQLRLNGKERTLDFEKFFDALDGDRKIKFVLAKAKARILKNDTLNQIYRYPRDAKIDITGFENTTVRGLLNEIVKSSSLKIWILEKTGASKQEVSFNF